MSLRKKILNLLHPALKIFTRWYLAKTRWFSFQQIRVKILPGVFHPGLFFSTRVLLEYLEKIDLKNLRVLELGAGSGLISIYCYKKGASVTATDISQTALAGIRENAERNNASIEIRYSDLFDEVSPSDFDLIVINPPYYPKAIVSEQDMPWFCGENFEYFEKLFSQTKAVNSRTRIIMILSEDCNIAQIEKIAEKSGKKSTEIFSTKKSGEMNYIFEISGE